MVYNAPLKKSFRIWTLIPGRKAMNRIVPTPRISLINIPVVPVLMERYTLGISAIKHSGIKYTTDAAKRRSFQNSTDVRIAVEEVQFL